MKKRDYKPLDVRAELDALHDDYEYFKMTRLPLLFPLAAVVGVSLILNVILLVKHREAALLDPIALGVTSFFLLEYYIRRSAFKTQDLFLRSLLPAENETVTLLEGSAYGVIAPAKPDSPKD